MSDPTLISIEPIVRSLANESSPAMFERLSAAGWDNLVITAIALGLAPLWHRQLTQAQIMPPPLALAKLALTHQAHAKRNEAIGQQLAELLAAFKQHKLEVMVLKGALLAATVYPEAALRPMNDIDLLFCPEDLPQVGPVLESLGYVGKHKDAHTGPGVTKHLSTYRRAGPNGSTPNPYLSAGGDRMVEPHGSLEESWFGLKVDITPGVWERATPILCCGQPAYRLSTNDLLLHLTVHAVFHVIMGSAVFVQLYDIGCVLKTWPAELNWPQILTLTHQAKAQPFVYAGLYWARTLYQAAVPETVLEILEKECAPDLVAYVQSLGAAGIFKRTQQPPLRTLSQRLQRGLEDRREAARWAGTLKQKWEIWQTALAFYQTDTASLLKKGLKGQG